ncbi:MAG: DUF1851 domain-containing protein [Hylemonella sp.]|uniref:T6SS immunity protein Tdi1 domain-containing protein n=1 Tax=Hylemonella sp. TaxID=2066020 RepID=UPI0022C3BC30|nr:T6SS immunity protein Tdi1 domain-containing protein [Hylemonella sp.]MCZ8253807.1 DUF1851 domain-containing protein [Hylemonella sp.]
MATWSQLTLQPNAAALEALREHWRWLLGEDWSPLLFSALGDVFLRLPAGTVWWLSTATGSMEQVADSPEQFQELLAGEQAQEWFLPGLIDVLRAQGKVLRDDQCYTYAIYPIFSAGSFSAENMHPVSAQEHFSASGHLHESLRKLPDGAKVQITITD